MPIRFISHGEKPVSRDGEAFGVHSKPPRSRTVERGGGSAVLRQIAIEYLGFQNVRDRREYSLIVHRGEQQRRYTVWIELAAFSRGLALLQDGPDICYQKLLHEIAGSELQ